MENAVLQEIIPNGLVYNIDERRTKSDRGMPVEVRYKAPWDTAWQALWSSRGDRAETIYDRSRVWRYRESLNWHGIDTYNPDESARHLVSLDGKENRDVGPFQLFKAAEYAGLDNKNTWFLMFGSNPSGSFKDGGMVSLFTQGKHLHVLQYICASTGNTSQSLAQVAANEMATSTPYLKRPIVVVPSGRITPGKLLGAIANRAIVMQIDGDFSKALQLVRSAVDADESLQLANSATPYRIEGQKAEMILLMEHFGWHKVPDWIVTPGGNYGSTAAIHKAFREMREAGWIDRLPRLAVINAAEANTLDVLHNERKVRWNNGNVDRKKIDEFYGELEERFRREQQGERVRHTDMTAIDIHVPADENLYKTLRAMEEMNGVVTSVTDEEAWEAKYVIDSNGLGEVDLASASTVAGMKKLVGQGIIEPTQFVVGRITGRDKDPEKSFERYAKVNPPIKVANNLNALQQALQALYTLR